MDEFGGGGGGYPDGRYVMVGGTSDSVRWFPSAQQRRSQARLLAQQRLFQSGKGSLGGGDFFQCNHSWKLTRETESGEWKLAEAKLDEKLDSGKASGVSNPLILAKFRGRGDRAKPEETGLGKPTIATLETFDGFNYTVKSAQRPMKTIS